MSETRSRLTVYFEDPFWVGVFEREEDGRLSAAKVTFGAEPRDGEIFAFILREYGQLSFGPAVEAAAKANGRNPKRARREAGRQTHSAGIGTKAQQALKLQREQGRQESKEKSRLEKAEEAERAYRLKRQKRRQKHRGR